MPVTSGVSGQGLQRLGFLTAGANRFVNVVPFSTPQVGRLVRVGTILVCVPRPQGVLSTSRVIKLYGHGYVWQGDLPTTTLDQEVWVNWFIQGYSWTCVTP